MYLSIKILEFLKLLRGQLDGDPHHFRQQRPLEVLPDFYTRTTSHERLNIIGLTSGHRVAVTVV